LIFESDDLFEGARQSLWICVTRQSLGTSEGEKEGKRARQSLWICVTRQSLVTREGEKSNQAANK